MPFRSKESGENKHSINSVEVKDVEVNIKSTCVLEIKYLLSSSNMKHKKT